ncbi:uncharacterized protein F5891DRAFT_1124516 [Suillus fuscotomentosus]|uniref:CxC2-like cysteine cluster KDZ transposase-associated domain-containing protein n=1 Tax=Suillus fuscotomentosus TaxID=1912939 RepID=A0AAD4EM92_9AGAM|nr:uncharacterized protein F5891DRAFT_1124516 [Suillus fuscotomentosus]KAG1907608.1 hypothetical protein F5891DRAFT_1124516 [Suillus fuscotomentosus]
MYCWRLYSVPKRGHAEPKRYRGAQARERARIYIVKRGKVAPCIGIAAGSARSDTTNTWETDPWEPTLGDDLAFNEVESRPVTVGKVPAKRYVNSDAPLHEWMGLGTHTRFHEEYLLEELRLEGCGTLAMTPCSCSDIDNDIQERLYRCEDCYGPDILCKYCCLSRHAHHPLHIIKKWNGTYFERTALADIGLRVQLGHEGMPCLCPQRGHNSFVVIHTNGIHRVNIDFCGCHQQVSHRQQLLRCEWYPATLYYPQSACTKRVLEFFLILTWSSKSRYKEFMQMVRQFRHIKLMKQAGRGNVMGGIYETQPGALAVKCPACPHPGINLPEDWNKVDESMKFLYYLIIAMDANFRLKNRARSSTNADPGLHTGLAYFVPEKPYVEHILRNASQTDISTCSGFRTLAHTESKYSSGLRATGIGLCLCARHEFVRLQGVGDLQKGERYANMDFIFFSSIMPLLLLSVVISYDIACQWKINLTKRMDDLPEHLQISAAVALAAFMFGIPKFHCPAHEEKCAIPHSLNLMPGVGRTDGEGIEHNWAEMNRVANSTKEMGPGSRHDVLDDHFGYHNWSKYTELGLSLWRKLLNAVKEHAHHQSFLRDFDEVIGDTHQGEWTAMIEAWERDKSNPNPYVLSRINLSEAQVRINLANEEKIAISNGHVLPHEVTPSSFMNMALVLEDAQQRIKVDVTSSLSTNQYAELHQRRVTLRRQLDRFRIIQRVYMAGIEKWIEEHDGDLSDDIEDEHLWLPSTLPESDREEICRNNIARIEAELRKGQCRDALDKLRKQLHTKSHFIKHRNLDLRGQQANTRATSFLARFDSKINAAAAKYRVAWSALLELVGISELEREKEFQCLEVKDIVAPVDTMSGVRSTTGMRGRTRSEQDTFRGLGQGYQTTSWIWLASGVRDDEVDGGLNDVLRVEWGKSRVRAQRWNEEVYLLKEEMRRTQQFLTWCAKEWESDAQIVAGAAAYANRQVAIQHALLAHFTVLWGAGVSANDTAGEDEMTTYFAENEDDFDNDEG